MKVTWHTPWNKKGVLHSCLAHGINRIAEIKLLSHCLDRAGCFVQNLLSVLADPWPISLCGVGSSWSHLGRAVRPPLST
eukprot:5875897-Amphidinium_carterae.2